MLYPEKQQDEDSDESDEEEEEESDEEEESEEEESEEEEPPPKKRYGSMRDKWAPLDEIKVSVTAVEHTGLSLGVVIYPRAAAQRCWKKMFLIMLCSRDNDLPHASIGSLPLFFPPDEKRAWIYSLSCL